MLKRLLIKNFQAHKKLELTFAPGVTTIVGPSDVGKSAVIRALTWIMTNRPGGVEFIREGARSTTVELEVDGHTILRERSKSVNRYVLDGQEFKAFGTEPPQEVLDVLNLASINFQAQHDSPFWFCETPGEISRQLNEIVNLSVIDSTLANLDRERREAMARVKVLEQEVEGAAQLRSGLAWAKQAADDLAEAEEYHTASTEAHEDCERLTNLLGSVSKYGARVDRVREAARMGEKAVRIGEEWASAQERRSLLDTLLTQIRRQSTVASQPIPDLSELEQMQTDRQEVTDQIEYLSGLILDVRNADKKVRSTTEEAQSLKAEFKDRMGEVCPLCGAKL